MNIHNFLAGHVINKKVLHVGCVGTLSLHDNKNFTMHRFLSELASDLHGIDIHEAGVKRMCDAGFNVYEGDAEHFICGEQYEVICILSTLQFVDSPCRIIDNLYKCLLPGGMLIISVPNVYAPYPIYRELFKFAKNKIKQDSGQSARGETYSFASHNLHNLYESAIFKNIAIYRCHSKSFWSRSGIRESLYNFGQFVPGLLFRALLPTLIAIGRK